MDDSSSASGGAAPLSAKELRALKKNPKRYLEYLTQQNKFKSAQLAARQNELSKAALQTLDPVEQWKRDRENAWIHIAEPAKPLFSQQAPVQTQAPSTSPENSRQASPVRRGRRGMGQGAALVQERRGDDMKQSLFPDHPDFANNSNRNSNAAAASSNNAAASIGSSHVRSSSIGAGEMDRHIRIRHTRTRSHSVTPAHNNKDADDDDDDDDEQDEEDQTSSSSASTQNGTHTVHSHPSVTTPRVRKSWIAPTTSQLEEMRALMEEQARLHALEEGIQQREKERMRFHPPPASVGGVNKDIESPHEESKENSLQHPSSSTTSSNSSTGASSAIQDSIRTDAYNEPPLPADVAPLLSRPLSLFNSDRITSTLAESNADSNEAVVADAGKFSSPPSLPPQDFSAPPLTFRSPQRSQEDNGGTGGAESEVETEVEEEEEMVRDRSFGRGQAQRQQKRKKWNKATPISIAASDGDRVVLSPEAPNSAKSPLLASRGSRDDSQLSPLQAAQLEAERLEVERVAEQARVEHVRRVLDFEHARNAAAASSAAVAASSSAAQSSPSPSPPISPAPSPPTTARQSAGAPPARLPPAPPGLPPSLPSTPRLPVPPESPPPESPRGDAPPLPDSARGPSGAETPRTAAGASPPSRAPPSRPPPSTPRVSAAVPHPPSHRPPPPPSRPPPSPNAAAAAASSSSSPPARAPPARPPPSKPPGSLSASFSPSGAQTSRVPAGGNNSTLVWHSDASKNHYVDDDDEDEAPREDWSDPLAGGERKRDLEEVVSGSSNGSSEDRSAPRYKLIFVDGDYGRYSSFYTSKKEREMARMAMERDMAQAREAAQAQGKSGSSLIQPHTSRVHSDRLKKWERPAWATGLTVRGAESTTLDTIPSAPGTPRTPDLPPTLPPTPRTSRDGSSGHGEDSEQVDPDLPPLPAQDGFETPRNAGNSTQRYRPTASAQPQHPQQPTARNEPQTTDANGNNKDNCIIA